jgi:hypothetical protein
VNSRRKDRNTRRLRAAWILLRLPVPLLLLAVVPGLAADLSTLLLRHVGYGHGLAKGFLGPWVTIVYRQAFLPGAIVAAVVAALVLSVLAGRRWLVAAGVFTVAALGAGLGTAIDASPIVLLLFLGLLFVNLYPDVSPGWSDVSWVPFTELFFPAPIARGLGIVPRVAAVFAAVWIAGMWFVVDSTLGAARHSDAVWSWPDARLDPRIRVLERAAKGIHSEFQGVDVAGGHVLVVAEDSLRLLAWPRSLEGAPAVQGLRPWWGPTKGLTLDSETDPATGTTWFLDGPNRVSAVTWEGDHAVRTVTSAPLPRPLDHAYTRWIPERNQLALVTVNVVEEQRPPILTLLDTPSLSTITFHELRTPDGRRVPHVRDIEWITSLGKMVLAPDFGTTLYLADPDTGVCEPWLEVPAMNGRMHYDATLDRLFLAMPNRFVVLVVDPHTGAVERTIPTQPGVRPLAVDAARGLLVTASIATGAVWVQRLDDGTLLDSFRTIMPMVREMALMPEEGIAIISTWTRVYAVPYGESAKR